MAKSSFGSSKGPELSSSTHTVFHNCLQLQFLGMDQLLTVSSEDMRHAHGIHTCSQNTHTHKNKLEQNKTKQSHSYNQERQASFSTHELAWHTQVK